MVGIALLVVLVGQLVLRYLPFGRRLYAIGSNPDAARVAGLPAQRDVFTAFTVCGALAGLAGFMFLVRFGNITVTAGAGPRAPGRGRGRGGRREHLRRLRLHGRARFWACC